MPLSEAAVTGLPRSHLLKHEPRCPVNGEFCHSHCQQHLHDSEVQPGGERPRAPPGKDGEQGTGFLCSSCNFSSGQGRTGGSREDWGFPGAHRAGWGSQSVGFSNDENF